MLLLEDYGMHPIDRTVGVAPRKELLALDCTRHDVADEGIFLRQIGCEIHFLPLVLLADAKARKAKVGADCCSFDKVKEAV